MEWTFGPKLHTRTGYYARGGQWYEAKQRRAVNPDELLDALRVGVDVGSSDDNTDGDGSDDDAAGCDRASYADVEGGNVEVIEIRVMATVETSEVGINVNVTLPVEEVGKSLPDPRASLPWVGMNGS